MKTHLPSGIAMIAFLASTAFAVTPAWKIYTNANTGLPGDYIYSLAIDSQNNKWIAGDDPIWDEGGLAKFDGLTFTDYTNVDAKSASHNLHDIKFDPSGNVWAASDVGLLKFDGSRVTSVWNTANAPIWPTNRVTDFAWDSKGNLWVALDDVVTVRGGLAKWDGSTWTLWTTANGIPWGQPWDEVTSIEIDAQDNVYIGSNVLGVAKFSGTTWSQPVKSGWVNDLQLAPNGELWIAFATGGVSVWNGSKVIDRTPPVFTSGFSLLALDRIGHIWVGTYIGSVWEWDGATWSGVAIPTLPSHIYALAFDSQNMLWAGGIGGMAHRLQDQSWVGYSSAGTALASRWIDGLYSAPDSKLWAGTAGGGLSSFDGSKWVGYNPYNLGAAPWPFATDSATGSVQDSSGRLWTTPLFHGLGSWNGVQWTAYLPFYDFQDVGVDGVGTVWASGNAGLYRFDGSNWVSANIPPANDVGNLGIDQQNNIWVGSITGLYKFNATSWTTYTTSNSGLPSNYINDIKADAGGVGIWFTTDVGVVHFDGVSSWTLYNKTNSGLPANVCGPLDFAPDATLWVGCFDGNTFPYLGGVAHFDGSAWTTYTTANSPLPHNQVTSLAIDGSANVWVGTASMGIGEILAGVNPLPPAAPSALTATSGGSSAINLAWTDNSADELGFQVQRCEGTLSACTSSQDFTTLLELGQNVKAFADSTVLAQTTYTYRIRAFNLAGYSFYSNYASATTAQQGPPPAPSNLVATPQSKNQGGNLKVRVQLTWKDNSTNENTFEIERCTGGGCIDFHLIRAVSPNVIKYFDQTVARTTTYSYRVRATSSFGNSGYSNIATTTTP
jgi:ligand-binding sensor domain-containing protein